MVRGILPKTSMANLETKILLALLSGLIVLSVYLSYQRTMIERDFETFDSETEIAEDELKPEESDDESAVETATSTDGAIL